mmetsp:Transcript_37875/g.60828  ORF Transcript_37875/g.60828 Transcript_37875/m.60828 type:complete len:132 (+) Transcript_37875:17-412(+)
MAVQLTLSADFGFVMLAIFSTFLTNMFLVFSVIKARKDFGVVYPALYAPPGHKHEDKFNCIQRAHQNYLETWSQVIILTLINGFFNPKLSAVFCFIFAVGRCIYGVGYQVCCLMKALFSDVFLVPPSRLYY